MPIDASELEEGREVKGVLGGGATRYGAYVSFTFQMADGSVEPFCIRHEALGKLLVTIHSLGALAYNDRLGRQAGTDPLDVTEPFATFGQPRIGRSVVGPDEIVMQFSTHMGVPLSASIPRDEARKLADRLRSEADRDRGPSGPRH